MKLFNGKLLAFEDGRDEMLPRSVCLAVSRACDEFFRKRGIEPCRRGGTGSGPSRQGGTGGAGEPGRGIPQGDCGEGTPAGAGNEEPLEL